MDDGELKKKVELAEIKKQVSSLRGGDKVTVTYRVRQGNQLEQLSFTGFVIGKGMEGRAITFELSSVSNGNEKRIVFRSDSMAIVSIIVESKNNNKTPNFLFLNPKSRMLIGGNLNPSPIRTPKPLSKPLRSEEVLTFDECKMLLKIHESVKKIECNLNDTVCILNNINKKITGGI